MVFLLLTHGSGYPSKRIVWLSRNEVDAENCGKYHLLGRINAIYMPLWYHYKTRILKEPSKQPPTGKVSRKMARLFVVYRFSLYACGFKIVKSISDPRFVTRCYILPLGLSFKSKRSTSAARVLSISPHGQVPNHIIKIVVDNVIQSSIQVFVATGSYSREVHVLLDMVAFLKTLPQRHQYVNSKDI